MKWMLSLSLLTTMALAAQGAVVKNSCCASCCGEGPSVTKVLLSPKAMDSASPRAKSNAKPRKVLVVTVTKGFRHSSIPTAEKVIGELAADSRAFIVDYARVEPASPEFQGADGKPDKAKVDAAIQKVLAEKMNPEALKQLDGIIFANTTGELPLPDKEAFLNWIKSGKAFVGMHAATDTFKDYPAYVDMIGGRFKTHGPQVQVDVLNKNDECAACRHFEDSWRIFEEIYIFQDFDPAKVNTIMALDKHPNDGTPGNFPLAWCRSYGKGKVFYTAFGHREDIWDDDTPPNFERKNSKEVALQYQKHILGGIKWALGMEKCGPTPIAKTAKGF